MFEEGFVPAGGQALVFDTTFCLCLFQHRERHLADQRQVFRAMPVAQSMIVFPERHIQHPVALVLDPATVPSRSDTVLVSETGYNAAGWLETTTDPRGAGRQGVLRFARADHQGH